MLNKTVGWAGRRGTWVQASILLLTCSQGLDLPVTKPENLSDQRSLSPLPYQEVILSYFILPWEGDLRLKFYSEKRLCHLL